VHRQRFLTGITAALALPFASLETRAASDVASELAAIEARTQGRLGVHAIDTQTRTTLAYRAHERFAMCSTFKFLLVAAVLSRVDRGAEQLGRRIAYGEADLLAYAPVARQHLRDGFMTVEEFCRAAMELSDNTAANVLLRTIGGPHGVTHYARSLGDVVTRLDRTEPSLNSAIPGDPRDTTTPAAMAHDMKALLLGTALSAASRRNLTQWMANCRTGLDLLRQGFPAAWRVADKTGSGGPNNAAGDSDTRNDIAIVWPTARRPILVAAYLTGCALPAVRRDAALADVGHVVHAALTA
jgi:beta-lactamase class A